MKRKIFVVLCIVAALSLALLAVYLATFSIPSQKKSIRLAVEFVDHAACAFIAKHKGFFEANGLNIAAFECYITGPALSAAIAREDIDAAYICLIPAICAYANVKVPIKIVVGIHKYGYALVVDPNKVKAVKDLEKPDVRIACTQKGTSCEILLRKMIEKYGLNEEAILNKVRYMNPPLALLSLRMGQIDAAFLPEQYPTMAEEFGFRVLLAAQDIWPNMQGSVLIVKESLLRSQPDVVDRLVKVTLQGTKYIYENPKEAAQIVASELQVAGKQVFPSEVAGIAAKLEITPKVILKSLAARVICSNEIDANSVQEVIDYMAKLEYIKWFKAEDILDLRFAEGK